MNTGIDLDLLKDANFDEKIDFRPVSLADEVEKHTESVLRSKPIRSYRSPEPSIFLPPEKKESVKPVFTTSSPSSSPSYSELPKSEISEQKPIIRNKTRSMGFSFMRSIFFLIILSVGVWAVYGVSFDLTKNFWEGELATEIECVKVHFKSVPSIFPSNQPSGTTFYSQINVTPSINRSIPQNR